MNKFYAKIPHYRKHPCTEKLVQHNILSESKERIAWVINPTFEEGIEQYTYSHGPHGCASPEKLVKLAANPKTRNHNYSMFNHVVNRQQSSKHVPKPKQTNPAENGRLKCYYSYLENVKTVGNKSPMPKTMHAYKSPALDIDNSNPVVAEETPDQALLDNILEDCLVEFDIKEKKEKAALDNIIENCLTSLTAEESKAAATNNLHSQLKDGLIAQRGSEYDHHEHCVLF